MRIAQGFVPGLFLLGFLTVGVSAQADDVAEAGRAILSAHKDAVVTVKFVTKIRFSMSGSDSQEDESKSEATGTVIAPSGLTVLSLFKIDPTSLAAMMRGMDESDGEFSMESEVTDAKIVMTDGTEIPAEVVLRDKDLDLAFLRPIEKPENPFPFIDLKAGTSLDILDRLITVNRLGKAAGRAHSLTMDRVEAVVKKPRTFYVPMGMGMTRASLGIPVFAMDGKVVGITVLRAIRSKGGMGMFGGGDNTLMIVLPTDDVLEVAEQAPEHAAEASK
jgi:S1-C subfamily serine protease